MAVVGKYPPQIEDTPKQAGFNELGIDLCRYRSDEQLFIRQQKDLARYFIGAPGPVVDLGCGHGTMLVLLKASGVSSYGVEAFPRAVDLCRGKGLSVRQADVFAHLAELNESSLGGIFCSHLIEHFHPPEALRLIRESYRVLKR